MSWLGRALLRASTNEWLASTLPRRPFVKRAVRRFMPGEELEDALREAERLAASGRASILTKLGENLRTEAAIREVVEEYGRALEAAAARGLDAEISIKPTHLGLDLDPGLLERNVRELAGLSGAGRTLWIDMEDSACTDATLSLYRTLKPEHENLGVCLQSYLRRTPSDLEALLPLAPRIRLVKGAYAEPPSIAYPAKREVDRAYAELARRLMDHLAAGSGGFLAIATHDPALIRDLAGEAHSRRLAETAYEFEMLYGIGEPRQERLAEDGQPVRILISYGEAWFPWYMRRLAERPANVGFVLRSLLWGRFSRARP